MNNKRPTVLITGASSGFGEALARDYARTGANLILCARRREKLAALADELQNGITRCLAVECDVRKPSDVKKAVQAAIENFGGLDIVYANAGFGVYGRIENTPLEDFERQFQTNIQGVLATVQAAIPALKQSQGRIGIVGSAFSYFSFPTLGPYCMSKYAVRSLAETLQFELAPDKVSTTMICPGLIGTDFRKVDVKGNTRPERRETIPNYLIMSPENAARQIRRAVDRRQREVIVTLHAKFGVFMQRHFPAFFDWTIRQANPRLRPRLEKELLG